jgi:hypothetical protein
MGVRVSTPKALIAKPVANAQPEMPRPRARGPSNHADSIGVATNSSATPYALQLSGDDHAGQEEKRACADPEADTDLVSHQVLSHASQSRSPNVPNGSS